MSADQQLILSLQVLLSIIVLLFVFFEKQKAKELRHKYHLYAVRDKLIYLVASGQLSEDHFLFQVFYGVTNRSIREVKELSLISFMRASVAAKSDLQKQANEKLLDEIEKAPVATKAVIKEFFAAMMGIAIANNWILVLIVKLAAHGNRWMGKISRLAGIFKILSPLRNQYDTYRYFENLRFRTAGY